MKLVVCILLFFSIFLKAPHVFAQDTGWVISLFESQINILKTGEIEVTEHVQVDYLNLDKHGIFRDIPYVYSFGSEKYYTDIEVKEILRDGKKEKYTSYKNGNNLQLKIGNPDKTISGQHFYSINYIVRGVLLPYEDFDELYWNVTGTWPVPVETARAVVSLPSESLMNAACYFGQRTSQEYCESFSSSKSALFSAVSLDPGEEMTVAVGFKKGTVPLITIDPPKTVFEKIIEPWNIGIFLLPILGGFFFILHHWYRNGRDLWNRGKYVFDPHAKEEIKPIGASDTIVVEYTAPQNLRPAEIGVLMDERADTLDVSATIIDLATRGYFTITEIPKKWIFGKIDYLFKKEKEIDVRLLPYEKTLMRRLFGDMKTVKTSELKNTFYNDLAIVKKELYSHVVKEKLFPTNPENVRTTYFIIGILIIIACVFGLLFMPFISFKMFFAGGIVFGLIFFAFSRHMPRRTAYGQEMYRRAKGYYLFISQVEKHRQQFFERKNMLNEVLPYAIVFGLTAKFAKALHEMGVEQKQPHWYVGHTAFNMMSFEKNIESFSSSLSSAISQAPRSSGSSGGGSSGGGFGGGGGGSW